MITGGLYDRKETAVRIPLPLQAVYPLLLKALAIGVHFRLVGKHIVPRPDLLPAWRVFPVLMGSRIVNHQLFLLLQPRVRVRNSGQKRLGVGMHRVTEKLFALRQLYDPPMVDDSDTVRNKAHHRQVMRN